MVDISQMLAEVLCPTNSGECLSAAQQMGGNIYGGSGTLIYLFLFPIVFIVVFVYILQKGAFGSHLDNKGVRLLIALAVYVFIVVGNLYILFVQLARFWLFALIGLGIFFMVVSYFQRGSGGGGMPGTGRGIAKRVTDKAMRQVYKGLNLQTLDEKQRDRVKDVIEKVEKAKKEGKSPDLSREEKIIFASVAGISASEYSSIEEALDEAEHPKKKKKGA